jgi:hypothetical protein
MTGWTTDASGNTIFAPTAPLHNGWLVIQAPAGSKANETDAIYIRDEDGVAVGILACDGGVQFRENLDSTDGFQFRIGAGGHSLGFVVYTAGGAAVSFRIQQDGKMGFFEGVPAVQQTLHSGTTTPELIALALEASTLMTGD